VAWPSRFGYSKISRPCPPWVQGRQIGCVRRMSVDPLIASKSATAKFGARNTNDHHCEPVVPTLCIIFSRLFASKADGF